MTYAQAIQYLNGLKPIGIQMGLERMEKTMEALGHPECAFPTIHIAGTNGKGSTASMIAAALAANGYCTGLFTSPAVTTLRDTVQINGQPVSEDLLAAGITRTAAAMPTGLSEFECLTAAMLCCFESRHVDIAVIECGLGGDEDATNILPAPLCAVFTPIALDHTSILGNTIEEIAARKSGIIKQGCDVVCAPAMDPAALGAIYEKVAHSGSCVRQPIPSEAANVFFSDGYHYTPTMIGRHQVDNAVTALAVLDSIRQHGYMIDSQIAAKAIAAVQLPCRLERIDSDPPLILDGAHNPQGIAALCDTLSKESTPVTLIIGMLADKDTDGVLRRLAPYCESIICCTPPDTPRPAMNAVELAAVAGRYHSLVFAVDDPVDALNYAKNAPNTTTIVVGGSFYTAAAVRRAITT